MIRELKGFICGVIITTIGITTVFAAGGIKSAVFNSNKVIFNGKQLNLSSNQMISVVKDGEANVSNYMPVRAVLEEMGYVVNWDGANNAIVISDKSSNITSEPEARATPNYAMYADYPQIPDFGLFVWGENHFVCEIDESEYPEHTIYYYYNIDTKIDETNDYIKLLQSFGFKESPSDTAANEGLLVYRKGNTSVCLALYPEENILVVSIIQQD